MSTHDNKGRPWAKLSEVKAGDRLEVDGGFDCLKKGAQLVVGIYQGDLYIPCRSGKHCIAGQADDGEHLVGLYKV